MNSQSTISGVVHLIEDTKTFGAKGFRKRLVVLEQDNGRFVNYIPIEFIQDSCDQVDQLQVGDTIAVQYRLSGRKWQRDAQSETRYFLSAEGLSFDIQNGGNAGGGNSRVSAGSDINAELDEAGEDMPF